MTTRTPAQRARFLAAFAHELGHELAVLRLTRGSAHRIWPRPVWADAVDDCLNPALAPARGAMLLDEWESDGMPRIPPTVRESLAALHGLTRDDRPDPAPPAAQAAAGVCKSPALRAIFTSLGLPVTEIDVAAAELQLAARLESPGFWDVDIATLRPTPAPLTVHPVLDRAGYVARLRALLDGDGRVHAGYSLDGVIEPRRRVTALPADVAAVAPPVPDPLLVGRCAAMARVSGLPIVVGRSGGYSAELSGVDRETIALGVVKLRAEASRLAADPAEAERWRELADTLAVFCRGLL